MSCWHEGAVSGSAMINSPERAAVMHTCLLCLQTHSSRATALGSLPESRIPIRFWRRLLDCSANILHQFMLPPTGHRGVGFFPKAVLSRGCFSTLPVVWKRFRLAAPVLHDQEVALSHFLYRPGRVRCGKWGSHDLKTVDSNRHFFGFLMSGFLWGSSSGSSEDLERPMFPDSLPGS